MYMHVSKQYIYTRLEHGILKSDAALVAASVFSDRSISERFP